MITVYETVDGCLQAQTGPFAITEKTVWIDMKSPTKDEDTAVEQALGVSVPTKEEMHEIEASSRVYTEGGTHYMTAAVLHQPTMPDAPTAIATPVTFILTANRLVTVRYDEPRAFAQFLARTSKKDSQCTTNCGALVGLLEAIIDREADRVERVTAEVDRLAHGIFDMKGGSATRSKRFDIAIKNIGREGELTSRCRECLLSLDRVLTYAAHVTAERGDDKAIRARIKTATRDIGSLSQHIDSVSNRVQFLLDATLGMISIEQNNIIKIFSVASVALMPPTLIASIYGMNFKHMPELEWVSGYPMAIVLMILAAVIPFVYFKRKGWY